MLLNSAPLSSWNMLCHTGTNVEWIKYPLSVCLMTRAQMNVCEFHVCIQLKRLNMHPLQNDRQQIHFIDTFNISCLVCFTSCVAFLGIWVFNSLKNPKIGITSLWFNIQASFGVDNLATRLLQKVNWYKIYIKSHFGQTDWQQIHFIDISGISSLVHFILLVSLFWVF